MLGVLAACVGLVGATLAGAPAQAADNPYERGGDPTTASIEAYRGSFTVSTTRVSSLVRGFSGGTVYYPNDTSQGTFGAVVIAPGYTASQSSMAWMGERIASQGFVVMTIDTNSRYDQPASRGDQLLAAVDYLTTSSDTAVRSRIDPTRTAVVGHSMGGGGTLEASVDRPSLKAAVALTPWNLTKRWSRDTVPTLVVGAENDTVASVRSHAIPIYNGLPASPGKAYLELNGASHLAPNYSNTTIAKYTISWLKRYVDDDTRYTQFLVPGPTNDRNVSDWRSSGL
ncbi:dienelactone hydrolase family protein [Sanguibacter sp. YZGR15]|uniref:Dienelactone hydrolase family protein n=2 Tax=Sanguibacter suaedae TaxID=2795737 RepID=A0A934MAJ0_9MICO|nr:dienelactone hydrolase family protein [Sanguibacter suaedae]